jgi:hypothetical protein
MAGGGLAELPIPEKMFHYAPGGIVAFATGDLVSDDSNDDQDSGGDVTNKVDEGGDSGPGGDYNPNASPSSNTGANATVAAPSGLKSLISPAAAILAKAISGDTDIPLPKDPEVMRQEILDKHPELAKLVNTIPGSELSALSSQLKSQNEATKAQFQEGQGRMGLAGLSNALIAAGEATRGHKGMALGEALGGFGKNYNTFTAEDIKRQQAEQALERQQAIETGKLDADIATLQQAYAKAQIDGRYADAANYQKAIADRMAKKQEMQIGAAEKYLSIVQAKENSEVTKAHYDALRKQAEASLALQKEHYASEAANRAEQLAIMKETRTTIEDKQIGKLLQVMPIRIRNLEARQKDLEFGSDEWNAIQSRIDDMYDQAYTGYGLNPPPRLPLPKPPVVKEKQGIFGGFSSKADNAASEKFANDPYGTGVSAAAPSTPNVMYATNPSTGQRIMSNDGGQTWSPLGGRR